MSKTNKFVGLVICTLTVMQVIVIYMEGILLPYSNNEEESKEDTEKFVIPPGADELIEGKFFVNYFYKSEGFGIHDIDPNDVTIALHGTVDKLFQLIEFGRVWSGPISMSVYAPGLDASFVDDAIDGLRMCWSGLRKSVTYHVVYPRAAVANMSDVGSFVYLSCSDIVRRLKRKIPTNVKSLSLEYPHNAMRNVAQRGVITHWVLHLDANIYPTPNLRSRFLMLVKKLKKENRSTERNSQNLFVLPVFELRSDAYPIDKKQNLRLALKHRNARFYMQEVCPKCQAAVDYDQWIDTNFTSTNGSELNVSYSVPYSYGWEPYFISSRSAPKYDERITSVEFGRIFHMCVLQSMKYKFFVLNDEFLLHRGYKIKDKMSPMERLRRDKPRAFRRKFIDLLLQHKYTDVKFNNCFT